MLQIPVAIPSGKAATACSYAYRDARRGSVDGAEPLSNWADGSGLPQVPASDVLYLLNEKWSVAGISTGVLYQERSCPIRSNDSELAAGMGLLKTKIARAAARTD